VTLTTSPHTSLDFRSAYIPYIATIRTSYVPSLSGIWAQE